MPKPRKKCRSESFGVYGSTIRLAERAPGGRLYLLWLDNSGKQRKRSLGHADWRFGTKQALELASQLTDRTLPGVEVGPLTLGEGISRAFDPVRGMYAVETKHVKQATTLAKRAAKLLGEHRTWPEVTPGMMQYLTRMLAQQSMRRGDGKGATSAERTCVVLYAVAAWLRQERLIPETAALPKRGWKGKLREEWRSITGRPVEPARPRYRTEEAGRIFAALPQGDPRVRLLVELAAELRAGQAVRARRSDLDLEPIGGFQLGRFVVHGAGKKRGEIVDLHPELRALVDEVLESGFLSEAEAAFRRGEVQDYFLFPAGRLRGGKVPLDRCQAQPLGPTAIRKMFHAVEKLAGVPYQAGRAFYGLRRQATDLAPEVVQDARVLNRLSGHADSSTRERVYQDRDSERVRASAATARRALREHLRHAVESGVAKAA